MIVKNEGNILGECLTSVKDLADEMVVVDTGSTDLTKFVAKRAGAKVFDFPWCDHYAKARNYSLTHCTSDWILMLDADEALYQRDHQYIRDAINSEAVAFNLPIQNYLPHKDVMMMGQIPVDNPFYLDPTYPEISNFPFYAPHDGTRLFKNMGEGVYVGRIHETPHNYFFDRGYSISETPAIIHHYGKMLFDREAGKTNYYLFMAQEEAKADPLNYRVWYNVLQQALVANQPEVVLDAARHYMRLFDKSAPAIIYIGAGMALRELGRLDEALVCFDAVLKHDPLNQVALKQKEVTLQIKK